MTKEQMRIVVAEIMGWKAYPTHDHFWRLVPPNPKHIVADRFSTKEDAFAAGYCQNYPEDLNACAEFERDVPESYLYMLYDVCNRGGTIGSVDKERTTDGWIRAVNASPLQRTEAFIRLHEKWVE